MKKLISMFVALIMIVSMFTLNVFAAGPYEFGTATGSDNLSGSSEGSVKLTVEAGVSKYAADIEFDNLEFTYKLGQWVPSNHDYTGDGAGWQSGNTSTITITNHSDLAIHYKVVPEVQGGNDNVTVAIDKGSSDTTINGCAATKAAVEETVNITLNGTPTTASEQKVINKITVTVSHTTIA